ncbi:MAG: hypothetical protein CMJ08_01825, partial [Pelagibacterales bacterium]|nr:hypothetical protein [Pelagibacterales bacterium]
MPVAILMPALSPTMTEGNVAKWLKKVGDEIKSGDIIAEVETDKATMEVEAIDDGVLAKIVHNDGAENISVNSLIGVISIDDETEEDIELFLKKGSGFKKEIDKPETNEKINSENNASNETISSDDKNLINEENNASNETISSDDKNLINEENNASNETISSDDKNLINEESKKVEETNLMESQISISPLAKRIASLKNINIHDIKGTGPRGRIIKRDLEVFLQDESLPKPNLINKADKRATQFSNKIPLTNIRRTIATRLQQSKQSVPHFYLKSKVYADEIIQARQVMNSLYQNENNKIKI